MPELPEVQTVVSDLNKHITGYRINKIDILSGYKVDSNMASRKDTLREAVVIDIERVGKNVIIKLSNGYLLLFHLGMTGRILLREPDAPEDPHQKVQITLLKNHLTILLRFCDMRMFGKVSVLNAKELTLLRSKYGPDLYHDQITPKAFLERIQRKNTTIKSALLEQSVVTGLGNIYTTEALWLSRIHPETKTSKINLEQAKSLLQSARKILKEGVLHRGSTLSDRAYVDIFGRPGKQQHHFRIYGKTLCPKCHTKIEYKKINGRGAYFCPICQK